MRRLALFVVHRRWWVLALALVVLPLAAVYGGGVQEKLTLGGFLDPKSDAAKAGDLVAERFPDAARADFVVLVTATDGTVDDAAVAAAGQELTDDLAAAEGVKGALSYWSLEIGLPLRSKDGSQALAVAALGGDDTEQIKTAKRLAEEFTLTEGPITTQITGRPALTAQISEVAEKDLQKAELFSAPVTFVALIIVFGSLVAAFLPLGVGLLAVLGTFAALTALTGFTDVSVFALNLTTAMGLGLAIDYSLFVVSRYREELAHGVSPPAAVGRTMQTAGRTVAFSAGTVAISLSALLLFPVPYVRSFAYAGVAVVGMAAIASIVVLPAILAVLGTKVDKGRIFKLKDGGGEFWKRQAERVMRRPVRYAVVVTALLVVLAIPFFHLQLGLADDRVVPDSVAGRAATDEIRENFTSRESAAAPVVVPSVTADADSSEIDEFARRLVAIDGVARVDAITGYYYVPPDGGEMIFSEPNDLSARFAPGPGEEGTYLTVVPSTAIEPLSERGEKFVADVRGVDAPFEFLVGGTSAELVDTKAMVMDRLPWALLMIALVTFVLLFMMTGSVLVPIKALLLNMLSLTATFGAMVWIFQDGHFSGLLDFTVTGYIDVFTPILMFCIAFGLSMDYEVFLISRIKEEYDLERDNERAVALGLQKTGRIVTAAALLLTIVFVGIATSDVSVIKTFGVGLSLAVLVDAFLIRATLVPAFMRMAGRSNWWSPRPLRRWHLRYGIWENEPIALLDREFETNL